MKQTLTRLRLISRFNVQLLELGFQIKWDSPLCASLSLPILADWLNICATQAEGSVNRRSAGSEGIPEHPGASRSILEDRGGSRESRLR